MTPRQKTKIYELLDQGFTTPQIVSRLRGAVSAQSVAACRAHWTMSTQPKVFEVQGTFLIQANSRDDALSAVSPRRVSGTKVLDSDVSASRISAALEADYLG